MQSLNDIWQLTLADMKNEFSDTAMELWFNPLSLVSIDGNCAVFLIQNNFKRDMVKNRHLGTIRTYLSRTLGFDVDVEIYSEEEGGVPEKSERHTETAAADAPAENVKRAPEKPDESSFYSTVGGVKVTNFASPFQSYKFEYTFDNFIVGNSNKFAHAACTAVAESPARSYNPLFIYGSSGLGKTHLLYAITNRIMEKTPDANIIYVKGEEFTNQIVESIARHLTQQFREKYRKADVLLVDDIQFIAGKESTQEEFFHTFNALYEEQKQIIMTSDRPPRDIKTLEDRLKTRFEWGLIADIQPPDYELRIAIMQNKAKMLGLTIPPEVFDFLSENLRSNIRQIEGAIKKIGAQSFLNNEPITVDLALRCISDLLNGEKPAAVTADRILSCVAKKYGVTTEDIKGRRRTQDIAMPRHIAIYIIRKMTDMSLPSIGKIFGRDHTTVMSSLDKVDSEIKANSLLELEITELMKDIREEK